MVVHHYGLLVMHNMYIFLSSPKQIAVVQGEHTCTWIIPYIKPFLQLRVSSKQQSSGNNSTYIICSPSTSNILCVNEYASV